MKMLVGKCDQLQSNALSSWRSILGSSVSHSRAATVVTSVKPESPSPASFHVRQQAKVSV